MEGADGQVVGDHCGAVAARSHDAGGVAVAGLEVVADMELVGVGPGVGGLVPVGVVGGAGDGGGAGGGGDGDVSVVAVGVGDVDRGDGMGLVFAAGIDSGQVVCDLVADFDLFDRWVRFFLSGVAV